jgi:hypothetical protein
MIGSHRPGWIAYSLIILAATIEFSLSFCCYCGAEHVALGKLYLALGTITLLGVVCLLDEHAGL